MRCIALTGKGLENIASADIKRLASASTIIDVFPGGCIFEASSSDLVTITYFCQSIERIGPIVYTNSHTGAIEEIVVKSDSVKNFFSFLPVPLSESIFAIRSSVETGLAYRSVDVVTQVSEQLHKDLSIKLTFKECQASAILGIYVNQTSFYVYVELCAKEFSKRDYKVFPNKTSLRGTLAYGITTFCHFKEGAVILDPFCRSGEIAIEFIHALTKKSIHYYHKDKFLFNSVGITASLEALDGEISTTIPVTMYATDGTMPNVKASEKNAKIAGVNKQITLSRLPIEDLDLKFNKNVDYIVTQLPRISAEHHSVVFRLYHQLFAQSKNILKKGALLYCIGGNIYPAKDIAPEYGCQFVTQHSVMQGQEDFVIFEFKYVGAPKKVSKK